MAGQLVQVDTETVTSAVGSVTLTGIDDDSVYMVAYNNVTGSVDSQGFRTRVSTSGTPKTTDYDVAYKRLRSDTTFNNISATGEPSITLGNVGTGTGEVNNGILYLYNFNNASEYSFATMEPTVLDSSAILQGNTGGFVRTVAEQNNEIHFYLQSGNFTSGTFTLYKIV